MKTISISALLCIICFVFIFMGCKKENIKPDLNFTDESCGCQSFIVYKINKEGDATLAVIGSRDNLNLSKTEQSFNLSNDLKIEVKRFKGDAKKYYCNDVPSEAGDIISTWTAYQGTVKLQIVQDSIAFNSQGKPEYKINVTIENIEFKNNNDKKFSVDLLEFKEVYVGWLPG